MKHLDLGLLQYRLLDSHRLVRLAMRNWLKMSAKSDHWNAIAVSRPTEIKSNNKVFDSYDMWSQFIPHAIEFIAADPLQGAPGPRDMPSVFLDRKLAGKCMHNGAICPRCTANLLHETAHGLCGVDNLADARAHAQRALLLKSQVLGEPDKSTVKSVRLLVQVTMELSEFGSAMMLCREVIETSRTGMG